MNDPCFGYHEGYHYDDDDDEFSDSPGATWRNPNRRVRDRPRRAKRPRRADREIRRERVETRDGTFRCRTCKTMVGPPVSGGRHRNHCPLCLYSRHVDRSRPGDRLSGCRSMMRPVGLFARRDGEQMLVHECNGCGVVRQNRVAADDNTVATMRLPIVSDPRESYTGLSEDWTAERPGDRKGADQTAG